MLRLSKWISMITVTLIVCVLLFAVVLLIDAWSSSVESDFVAYEPQLPLADRGIVEATKENSLVKGRFERSYKQVYSSHVVLTQTKRDTGPEPQAVACANRDKPANRIPGSRFVHDCEYGTTKHGGEYAITKVYRDGELIRAELRASIGMTWMQFHIPESEQAQVAEFAELQNYFDSMKPIDVNSNRLSEMYRIIKLTTFK